MKKFSLILALTMLCGMFQTGYTANAAANSTAISENFESYEKDATFDEEYVGKWGVNGANLTASIAEDETHGKYVKATNSSDVERHFMYRTTLPMAQKTDSAHIMKYEMDIKPAEGTIVYLTQGNTHSDVSQVYGAMFMGGKIYIGAWGNGTVAGAGTYTEGNWYHIVAMYDLAKCKLHTYIMELSPDGTAANNIVAAGETITGKPAEKTGAYGISYSIASNTEVSIDNVNIYNTDKWNRTLVDANYGENGITASADNQTLLTYKWQTVSADEDHIIQYDVDLTPTVFSDIRLSGTSGTLWGALFYSNSVSMIGWNNPVIGQYTLGTKYHVHIEYDPVTGWNYVKVTDNSGNSCSGYYESAKKSYDIGMSIWGNTGTTVYNVQASTTSRKIETPFEESFESYQADQAYADGYTIYDMGGDHGKVLYKKDNGNKSVAAFSNTDSARALGESNKVKYELDIMPGDGAFVFMATDKSTAIYLAEFLYKRLYFGAFGNGSTQPGAGIYEPNRWYHLEAVADFNTHTFDSKITSDKGVEYELTGISFNGDICKGLNIDGTGMYLDNIKISNVTADEFVNKTELKYIDSFDDYADVSAFDQTSPNTSTLDANHVKINGWKINSADAINASSFAERTEGGKYFNLGIDSNGTDVVTNTIEHKFNTTVSGGKFSYSYDIMPSADVDTATVRIAGTNADGKTDSLGQQRTAICPIVFAKGETADGAEYQILTMSETAILDHNSDSYTNSYIGDYTPGQWYHCDVTVDVTNGTYSYTIEDQDGNVHGGNTFHAIPDERPETDYTGITLMCWSDTSTSVGFDNFEIAYDTETPELDSISYKAGGKDYEEAVGGADTVILNFNTALSGTSFRDGVVKLTDESGNEVTFSGEVKSNKYYMTLDNTIQANVTYTITVSDAVASANLENMTAPVSKDFKGEKGASIYSLTSVEPDGEATWDNIKEFGLTSALTATVDLNNTGDKDESMYLIDARYDISGNLNYVKIYPITAEKNKSETRTVTLDEQTADKYAKYKFMLWDGFESMIPVSDSITH